MGLFVDLFLFGSENVVVGMERDLQLIWGAIEEL